MTEGACQTCWGCGNLASTEQREPWVAWLQLPVASAAAVHMGLVRPIPCPDCAGSGLATLHLLARDTEKLLDPSTVFCPECTDRGWFHVTRIVPGHKTEVTVMWCAGCHKLGLTSAKAQHAQICGCASRWENDR